jgi:hypothetical protein
MNQGDGIEDAPAEHVPQGVAGLLDAFSRQGPANIRLELPDDFGESESHPWPPENAKVLYCPFTFFCEAAVGHSPNAS